MSAAVIEKKQVIEIDEPIFIEDEGQEPKTKKKTDQDSEPEEEEETPECGICFDPVKTRGVIDCCQHQFCYSCISQWGTQQNTCPVCQRRFEFITQTGQEDSKKPGRKRKRSTAQHVSFKNQRTTEWNPTMEELLQIADTDQFSPQRNHFHSPYAASLRSAQLVRAHAAHHLSRSASSRPTRPQNDFYRSHSHHHYPLRSSSRPSSSTSLPYPRPNSNPPPSYHSYQTRSSPYPSYPTRSRDDFFRPYHSNPSSTRLTSSNSPSRSDLLSSSGSPGIHVFSHPSPHHPPQTSLNPHSSSPWRQTPSSVPPPRSQAAPPPRRRPRSSTPVMIDLTSDEERDDDDVIPLPLGIGASRAS